MPAAHPSSSFDRVISGLLGPSKASHDASLLGEACRVLRPSGRILMQELAQRAAGATGGKSRDRLVSQLKLSGFVDVGEVRGLFTGKLVVSVQVKTCARMACLHTCQTHSPLHMRTETLLYTHTHTCIHTHTPTHSPLHTHTETLLYTHTHVFIHTHTPIHSPLHTQHPNTQHIHTHTCIHTHTHTNERTHVNTHTHTHTHTNNTDWHTGISYKHTYTRNTRQ